MTVNVVTATKTPASNSELTKSAIADFVVPNASYYARLIYAHGEGARKWGSFNWAAARGLK